jgi:hypothetical protein
VTGTSPEGHEPARLDGQRVVETGTGIVSQALARVAAEAAITIEQLRMVTDRADAAEAAAARESAETARLRTVNERLEARIAVLEREVAGSLPEEGRGEG